jgi:DNA-binding transcriptional LysR family regulator
MRNLSQMTAFVTVVDAGGFVAAAPHLGLTPQAVHKAVATMEAELGLRLFTRAAGRGVIDLTEAGAAYLKGCRRVLAAVEDMRGTLADYQGGGIGPLRVSMPPALGRLHLMPAMGGFVARHPGIGITALLTERLPGLADEGVDVAFWDAGPAELRLEFRTLAVPTCRISASPVYFSQRGIPAKLADLEAGGHECISLASSITGKPFPWRFRGADGGLESHSMRGRLAVTDSDVGLAAAVAGLGIVQLPDHIAGKALATGELVEILPEHRHDGPPISIGRHPVRHVRAEVQVFIDYFVEWFASGMGGAPGMNLVPRDSPVGLC